MVISPTMVEVSWSEVDAIDQNGIIITYEVDYQPLATFEVPEGVRQVNTSNTTILLEDLHEAVQYNITVRAFTSIGAGPFSPHTLMVLMEASKFKSQGLYQL